MFLVITGLFIARALAQYHALFLFDEPTSALDIRYQIEVMETMRRITREQGESPDLFPGRCPRVVEFSGSGRNG